MWECEVEAESEEEAFAKAYLAVGLTDNDALQSVTVENNSYVTWNNSKKAIVITSLPTTGNVKVKITVKVAVGDKTIEKVLYVTVSSRNVTPIQPGGDYDTDDRYDGYYGEIVTPIQPGGNYDAPDYGD